MKIPKYVQELMSRSKYAIGYGSPGYTLEIYKSTPYTRVETLRAEIIQLEKWVKKMMPPEDEIGVPTIVVNRVPVNTHYCEQYAVVTIYDPVMKWIEEYVKR